MSNLQLSLRGPGEEEYLPESVATFVTKLWSILAKPDYYHLICWSADGITFIVKDATRFSVDVLPHYFKHHNFQSFVRQLNLYGFRKVPRFDNGALSKARSEDIFEFSHEHFQRNHPEKLKLVQRRVQQGKKESKVHKSDGETEKSPHRLSAVISDIHQMKGRQEGIASILEVLKQDNSHLRHELVLLKEKHIRQHKILNKIIHFLVQMVYKRKLPSARRSTRPTSSRLMLMESDLLPSAPKKMRVGTSDPIEELSLDLDSPSIELPGFPPLSVNTDLVPPMTELADFQELSPPLPGATMAIEAPAPAEVPLTSASSISSVSSLSSPSPSTPANYTVTSPGSQTSPFQAAPSQIPLAGRLNTDCTTNRPMQPTLADILACLGPTSSQSKPQDTPTSADDDLAYPLITESLLETYPIPPAPSSLVPAPHPENQMCIRGQINHQQLGLNNLPHLLSNHLDMDPNMFVLSDEVSDQLPDYNYADTARLLESLMPVDESDDLSAMIDPSVLVNLGALVPAQGSGAERDLLEIMSGTPSPPPRTETTVLESSSATK